jgi:acetoin utilization deacetylase AcuC-like enzyme
LTVAATDWQNAAMKTALITSADCDLHRTDGHIEAVARRGAIMDYLAANGLLIDRPLLEPAPADDTALARVHDRAYLALIAEAAATGGGWLDHDTMVTPGSDRAARVAAGGALLAVHQALSDRRRAFAVVRPPGHHALTATGMGFCLFNSVAVAGAEALAVAGLSRLLIVDWDVHHGNGTQAIFEAEPRVGFFSLHQWPHYPGSGLVDETGIGPGEGTTLNVPLPAGTGDAGVRRLIEALLVPFARRLRPELIVVSAGYDAHRDDPLGGLRLTTAGYGLLTRAVCRLAEELCQGRVAFVLEGGYNLTALAESVAATLRESDRSPTPPEAKPPTTTDDGLVGRVIEAAVTRHRLRLDGPTGA